MIKGLKLISGEEIIAECTSSGGGMYASSPMKLAIRDGEDDDLKSMIYLTKFNMFSEDEGLFIAGSNILALYTPSDAMIKYYFASLDYTNNRIVPLVNETLHALTDSIRALQSPVPEDSLDLIDSDSDTKH